MTEGSQPHYLSIEKKKRQITLTDLTTTSTPSSAASQERAPKVAAPKIFAFDNLFTDEDAQSDVTSSALSEVIPAVLEGTDGCLFTLGYAESGMWKIIIFLLSLIKCNTMENLFGCFCVGCWTRIILHSTQNAILSVLMMFGTLLFVGDKFFFQVNRKQCLVH